MPIIAMTNQKGGVGKTTSTLNLGAAFARLGRRTLIIDDDPQSSLTQGLLTPDATFVMPPERTIYALFAGLDAGPSELVVEGVFPGLDLLPGSPRAGSFNRPEPHTVDPDHAALFAEGLDRITAGYDVVLIDTAPSLQFNTWVALLAADAVLVPAQAEAYGNQGIAIVFDWLHLVGHVRGRALPIAGLLVNQHKSRRGLQQAVVDALREHFPETLSTAIPDTTDIPEAINLGKPVQAHKPRGTAAKAYDAVAREIGARLAALGLMAGDGKDRGEAEDAREAA
ncbi:ParA family protein [Tautonia plasticadhaerens]|uniref:MinD/ParA/CobQ/CobA-like protein n=1 Tax=Tautonia plasticadhaerens TaxID=2527974 RepID=A0A518HEY6_9BACT|nr:ParA family protein [Tautonia plasticadhaerens]QDV39392.1 MinD/ParA/CobQ/CobA-like protein [Tautonia plasticadhaerens]